MAKKTTAKGRERAVAKAARERKAIPADVKRRQNASKGGAAAAKNRRDREAQVERTNPPASITARETGWLARYVSRDDHALNKSDFLKLVSDRIREDLGESSFFGTSFKIISAGNPMGVIPAKQGQSIKAEMVGGEIRVTVTEPKRKASQVNTSLGGQPLKAETETAAKRSRPGSDEWKAQKAVTDVVKEAETGDAATGPDDKITTAELMGAPASEPDDLAVPPALDRRPKRPDLVG
jgi:hypothetical protein